jgi:N-acetyltransferase
MDSLLDVQQVTMDGRLIRLEPLHIEHEPSLWEAASPEIFRWMGLGPSGTSRQAFTEYIQASLEREGWWPHVILLKETGDAAGITCYIEAGSANRGVEIGGTWIGLAHQRTKVNPESKYLLLKNAFENLGAVRVQLRTDARNEQSQAAIAKLGAKQEGFLRKHMTMPDGFIRDTVVYSIIDTEWPAIKERLRQRLGYKL